MNIDYFGAAERDLRSLPMLKRSVEILKIRQRDLVSMGAPRQASAADLDKPYIDARTVNDALGDLLSLSHTKRELKKTTSEIDQIELALSALPDEQRKVLIYYYIDGKSADEIGELIHVESEKTVYSIRNRGIMNYALAMYGASARDVRFRGKK